MAVLVGLIQAGPGLEEKLGHILVTLLTGELQGRHLALVGQVDVGPRLEQNPVKVEVNSVIGQTADNNSSHLASPQ